MKANTHLLNYRLPTFDNGKEFEVVESGAMTRRGVLGEGKTIFSEEDKAIWSAAEEKEFGDDPSKLNWARNGGRW